MGTLFWIWLGLLLLPLAVLLPVLVVSFLWEAAKAAIASWLDASGDEWVEEPQ